MDELIPSERPVDGQNGYVDPITPDSFVAKRDVQGGEFVTIGVDVEQAKVVSMYANDPDQISIWDHPHDKIPMRYIGDGKWELMQKDDDGA
jgi:hypothetical protein